MPDIDIQLRDWVGRSEQLEMVIDPAQAARIAATLDHGLAPAIGEALPPLWHWSYFMPAVRQSELGPDGHPKRGGFMPPVTLPRRMWAGGRLRFRAPILIGDRVTRRTEIIDIVEKSGSAGPLLFVTLRRTLSTPHGVAIEEEQDIVFRGDGKDGPSANITPEKTTGALWRDPIFFDSVLLFRYSALTFNAHRIHYDLPYAQQEEGYPGLVVHGPLTATLLVNRLLAKTGRRLVEFRFRGQRPLIAGAEALLCGKAGEDEGSYNLWAESTGGQTAMAATAWTEAIYADRP